MNSFYVSIIFIGIMLVLISLVMIAYDRKKAFDYKEKLNGKKEELESIIYDADQMIMEMNKFSDYIVNQLELKNEEINSNLKMYEERHNKLTSNLKENYIANEIAVNGGSINEYTDNQAVSLSINTDMVQMPSIQENISSIQFLSNKTQHKSKEKVIQINNKYNSVIQLSQKGYSDTEIARSLNMGKGEVQLIIEMNK